MTKTVKQVYWIILIYFDLVVYLFTNNHILYNNWISTVVKKYKHKLELKIKLNI